MISEVPPHPRVILRIENRHNNSSQVGFQQQHDLMKAGNGNGQSSPAPKGFSYFRQPRQWPASNGQQTSVVTVNQRPSMAPIPPPPPPPPPPSNMTAAKSIFSGQSFVKRKVEDQAVQVDEVDEDGLPERRCRASSPDHLSLPQIIDHHSGSHFHPHQVPAPQIRKSLSHKINPQIKDGGPQPMNGHPNFFLSHPSVNNRVVEVRNEATQTRGPPTIPSMEAIMKPANQLLSLLYFLFHLSLTICLIRISDVSHEPAVSGQWSSVLVPFQRVIVYYLSYLMATSFVFIFLIRCCKSDFILFDDRLSVIFFSVVTIGFGHLISIGLEFSQCNHKNDYFFLPILDFLFSFFLIHFLFRQARYGIKIGFSNISVAHLMVTQVSVWLVHFDSNYGICAYSTPSSQMSSQMTNNSSTSVKVVNPFSTIPLHGLLTPVVHHYQLLIMVILSGIWMMNNDSRLLDACQFPLKRRRSLFVDDEVVYNFTKRTSSVKGFFMGIIVFAATIIVLFHEDHQLSLITHTGLQALAGMATIIGLLVRSEKIKPYFPSATPTGKDKLTIHNIIVVVTICATYYCAICMIVGNLLIPGWNYQIENSMTVVDGVFMLVHVSLQTFLIQSSDRKTNSLRQMFAFLILSNLSLWVMEVSQMSIKINNLQRMDLQILPPILMSLYHFYSSVLFVHFWK